MLTWVLMSLAHAECTEDGYSRMLHAASRAEYAFASLDEPALVAAATDLRGAIPCVRSPISAPDAALMHRGMAIIAFFEHHDDQARQAWASARALQPAWEPGETLLPPGHALHTLWLESAKLQTGTTAAPYAAPGGWVVDGLVAQELPTGRPFVLQGLDSDGAVAGTAYQWTAEVPKRSVFGFPEPPPMGEEASRVVAFRASAVGGVWTSSAAQEATGDVAEPVRSGEASGIGAATALAVFVTPVPVFLMDGRVSLAFGTAELVGSPTDFSASAGAAVGPSLGSRVVVSPRARVGARLDRVGALTSSDGATAASMASLELGVLVAVESSSLWLQIGATQSFAAAQIPYLTEVAADAQVSLAGPMALALRTSWSTGGMWLETAEGERAARRRESGLFAAAGLAVNF